MYKNERKCITFQVRDNKHSAAVDVAPLKVYRHI